MSYQTHTVVDVDGDGSKDLILASGLVLLARAGALVEVGQWLSSSAAWRYAGDFNGDRRSDLLDNHVLLSIRGAYEITEGWTAPAGGGDWRTGDFNGDGFSDLVRVEWGVTGAHVFLSDGASFRSAGGWTLYGPGGQGWYVGDFNGDGRSDILRTLPGLAGAEVLLSTGNSFTRGQLWSTHGNLGSWLIADLNSDGRDDLIDSAGNVYLSSGENFAGVGRLLMGGRLLVGISSSDELSFTAIVQDGAGYSLERFYLVEIPSGIQIRIVDVPRIAYHGREVVVSVGGLSAHDANGYEVRLLTSASATEWTSRSAISLTPELEGIHQLTLQVRDQTGKLVLEDFGSRAIPVFAISQAEDASDIGRLSIAYVSSAVSWQVGETHWRDSVSNFTELHSYICLQLEIANSAPSELEAALFTLQFVSGLWPTEIGIGRRMQEKSLTMKLWGRFRSLM